MASSCDSFEGFVYLNNFDTLPWKKCTDVLRFTQTVHVFTGMSGSIFRLFCFCSLPVRFAVLRQQCTVCSLQSAKCDLQSAVGIWIEKTLSRRAREKRGGLRRASPSSPRFSFTWLPSRSLSSRATAHSPTSPPPPPQPRHATPLPPATITILWVAPWCKVEIWNVW